VTDDLTIVKGRRKNRLPSRVLYTDIKNMFMSGTRSPSTLLYSSKPVTSPNQIQEEGKYDILLKENM
jgi:hypothetical protein